MYFTHYNVKYIYNIQFWVVCWLGGSLPGACHHLIDLFDQSDRSRPPHLEILRVGFVILVVGVFQLGTVVYHGGRQGKQVPSHDHDVLWDRDGGRWDYGDEHGSLCDCDIGSCFHRHGELLARRRVGVDRERHGDCRWLFLLYGRAILRSRSYNIPYEYTRQDPCQDTLTRFRLCILF